MNDEIKTEVTSIANEEAKTGTKIETPSAEKLLSLASSSFLKNRRSFNTLFSELSARGKTRVMNAVLDLPTDGVPVLLKDEKEKGAFGIGQRVIADRFIITYYHILSERQQQLQAEKEAVTSAPQETVDTATEQA